MSVCACMQPSLTLLLASLIPNLQISVHRRRQGARSDIPAQTVIALWHQVARSAEHP